MLNPRVAGGAKIVGWFMAGTYFGGLMAVSLASHEITLEPGQAKHFCGFYLDCHLAVSVEEVVREGGVPPGQTVPQPEVQYYVVFLRVSNSAIEVPLRLHGPEIVVIDAGGRRYRRDAMAEQRLAQREGPLPVVRAVEAGFSYRARLVFALPSDVRQPRLLVTEGPWYERLAELFLIGDEDSFLHQPTMLALDGQGSVPDPRN